MASCDVVCNAVRETSAIRVGSVEAARDVKIKLQSANFPSDGTGGCQNDVFIFSIF